MMKKFFAFSLLCSIALYANDTKKVSAIEEAFAPIHAQLDQTPDQKKVLMIVQAESLVQIDPAHIQEMQNEFSRAPEMSAKETDALMKKAISYLTIADAQLPEEINKIIARGVKLIVISSFHPSLAGNVITQLKSQGLDFNAAHLAAKELTLSFKGNVWAHYINGVLFVADPTYFEAALEHILGQSNTTIESVMMFGTQPEAQ